MAFILIIPLSSISQINENSFIKYSSWLVLQAIPSPVVYQNNESNKINFGLRWQIIPLNYSFSANKYVSSFQTFFIKPVRRFAGSAEIFIQPELSFKDFNQGEVKKFWFSGGTRVILPITPYGELLSASFGLKYNFHKSNNTGNYAGIEGGLYVMGGMGMQLNYNFSNFNKYNLGLFIKYY